MVHLPILEPCRHTNANKMEEAARIKNALFYVPGQVPSELLYALSQSGFRLFVHPPAEKIEGTYVLRTYKKLDTFVSFAIDRVTKVTGTRLEMELVFNAFRPRRTYTNSHGKEAEDYGDWPESFKVDLSDKPKASIMPAPKKARVAE